MFKNFSKINKYKGSSEKFEDPKSAWHRTTATLPSKKRRR